MLIRSQDKSTIVNVERATKINMCHGKNGIYGILVKFPFTDNKYKSHIDVLGEYSTEEKALKVLDMIQIAYYDCDEAFVMPQDSEV